MEPRTNSIFYINGNLISCKDGFVEIVEKQEKKEEDSVPAQREILDEFLKQLIEFSKE